MTLTDLRHQHVQAHIAHQCSCSLWYVPTIRIISERQRTQRRRAAASAREKFSAEGAINPCSALELDTKS